MYNSDRCKPVTSSQSSPSGNPVSTKEIQPIEYQSRTLRRFMSYSILYNPDTCKGVTSKTSSLSGNPISPVEVQPIEIQSRTVRRFMSYSAIVYNSNSCIAVTSSPSKQSGNSKYCKQRGYQDTHKAIILQKEREKDQLRLEIARSYFANQCMKWYWKCLEESSIGINKLGRPCIEWKSLLR